MTKISRLFLGLSLVTCFALPAVAQQKTDVRALVSRPPETSRRTERRCKVDADCVPIMCRSFCGFDDVVNKKFVATVQKRCDDARAARDAQRGAKLVVDCAPRKSVEKVSCKKRYCTMTETFANEPLRVDGPEEDSDH